MPLAAEESGASKAAIDSLSLGSHVFGPKVSVEDLKGHVVLIDFWGATEARASQRCRNS
jgi:hypothetical protein